MKAQRVKKFAQILNTLPVYSRVGKSILDEDPLFES